MDKIAIIYSQIQPKYDTKLPIIKLIQAFFLRNRSRERLQQVKELF